MVVGELVLRMAADVAAVKRDIDDFKRRLDSIGQTASTVGKTLGSFFVMDRLYDAAAAIIKMSDSLISMQGRLRVVTQTAEGFNDAMRDLYRISQAYITPLETTGTLYTRLTPQVRALGGGTREASGIVEAFSASLKISNATTQEAQSAIIQFSQAMGSGVLRGEEFNAVNEASPRIMQSLAKSLNVPVGALKEMAAQGELTAEIISNALLKELGNLQAEAANIPLTVSGAFTLVRNEFMITLGVINELTGGFSSIAEAVQSLGRFINLITTAFVEYTKALGDTGSSLLTAENLFRALGYTLETLLVLGAELTFVFKSFGLGIGGAAARISAFISGDWVAAAKTIPALMEEDLQKLRSATDSYTSSVVGATDKAIAFSNALKQGRISTSELAAENNRFLRQGAAGAVELSSGTRLVVQQNDKLRESIQKQLGKMDEFKDALHKQKIATLESQEAELRAKAAAEGGNLVLLEKADLIKEQIVLENQLFQLQNRKSNQRDARKANAAAEALKAKQEREKRAAELKWQKEQEELMRQEEDRMKRMEELAQQKDIDDANALLKIQETNTALQEKINVLTLTEQELFNLEVATLRNTIAELEYQSATQGGNFVLEKKAELLREQVGLLYNLRMAEDVKKKKKENEETAKDFAAEQDRALKTVKNSISNTLRQAIMEGSLDGADFMEKIFKSLVLSPIVDVVTNPAAELVSGAVKSGFIGGSSGGAGSLFGSVMPMIGSMGTIFGTGMGMTMAGNTMAAFSSAGAMFNAGMVGSGAAMGIGAAVPYIAAAMLLASLDKKSTPHIGGQVMALGGGQFQDLLGTEGGGRSPEMQQALQKFSGGIVDTINSLTETLTGVAAGVTARSVLISDSNDPSFGIMELFRSGGQKLGGGINAQGTLPADAKEAFDEYARLSAGAMVEALLQLDLPAYAKEAFQGLKDTFGEELSMEEINKTVEALVKFKKELDALRASFAPYGGIFSKIAALSDEAAADLIAAGGGMESFGNSLKSYYDNFYTEAERTQHSVSYLAKVAGELGYQLPNTTEGFMELVNSGQLTRQTFRDIVEAQDLNTESGAANYTALMKIADAYAELVPGAEDVAELTKNQKEILEERLGLEEQLLVLQGDTAELRRRERESLDESNRGLYDQIKALEDAQEAMDKMKEASEALANAIDSAIGSFLVGDELNQFKAGRISESLAGVGINLSADELLGLDKQTIYDFVKAFIQLDGVSAEAKTVVVEAAGALGDLLNTIEEANRQETINSLNKELDDLIETYGDVLSAIEGPKTLVESYKENVAELDNLQKSLANILGEVPKTVQDVLSDLMSAQKALQDFRKGLADDIREARLGAMSPQGRIAALRAEEASLFAQLPTASDPVAVAQRLQKVIIDRISEESRLRQDGLNTELELSRKVREEQISALEEQIDGLQQLKDLASEITQFTSSLRFSDISPLNYENQLNQAKQLFESTLEKARGGDPFAISNLTSNAKAYLDEARDYYASGPGYAAIFNRVTGSLDSLATTNVDPQLAVLQAQLEQLQALTDGDIQDREDSAEMLGALLRIDEILARREEENAEAIEAQKKLAQDQIEELKKVITNQEAQITQLAGVATYLGTELEKLNNFTERSVRDAQLESAQP